MDDDELAAPARRRRRRKGDRRPDRFDADLLARLLPAALTALLVLAAQLPAERLAQGLRHEHQQIGMRARRVQPAARAAAARTIGERKDGLLAKPAFRQCQCELELADVARAVDQERVRAPCRERPAQGLDQPRHGDRLASSVRSRVIVVAAARAH
jgi:hypothetical protein